MSTTVKTMSWMAATLLAATLALPGTAGAHDRDGYRGDWDDHGRLEWHRPKPPKYWRHHRHDYRDYDRPVVVIREPVYVKPARPAPPPPWVPLAIGIAGLLHGD